MNTEDFVLHDECPRHETWSREFDLPKIPLVKAMHDSLRIGLLSGNSKKCRDSMMSLGATPGIDIEAWNVYDQVVHHSSLMEVICAYLLATGTWEKASPVGEFEPNSYIMEDGRLRRVVLCSSWNTLRENEERISWRTLADTCVTNRPMLLNIIVIGQARKGFRPSPWTQGFIHPENGILRVKRIPSEKTGPNPRFSDNWKKVYRENTDESVDDWLTTMQKDHAFEELVFHSTINVPPHRNEVLYEMKRITREIEKKSLEMRRSSCFRMVECPMARLCHHSPALTPESAGWQRKCSTIDV